MGNEKVWQKYVYEFQYHLLPLSDISTIL